MKQIKADIPVINRIVQAKAAAVSKPEIGVPLVIEDETENNRQKKRNDYRNEFRKCRMDRISDFLIILKRHPHINPEIRKDNGSGHKEEDQLDGQELPEDGLVSQLAHPKPLDNLFGCQRNDDDCSDNDRK